MAPGSPNFSLLVRGRSGGKVPRNGRLTNPVPGHIWTLAGRLRAASGGAMRRRATSGSLGCRERDLGVACAGRGFGVNPQDLAGWDPHSKSWENAVYPGPKVLESFTLGRCQEVEWQGRGQAGWLLAGSGPSCLVHSSGALSRVRDWGWGEASLCFTPSSLPLLDPGCSFMSQYHSGAPRSTGITRWFPLELCLSLELPPSSQGQWWGGGVGSPSRTNLKDTG